MDLNNQYMQYTPDCNNCPTPCYPTITNKVCTNSGFNFGISSRLQYDPDYIDDEKYEIYESHMESTFGLTSEIAKCFYNYFIKGYEKPKSRPPYKYLIQRLKGFALTI